MESDGTYKETRNSPMAWQTAKMLRRGRMKHFLFAQNARKSVTRFILIRAVGLFFFSSVARCARIRTQSFRFISLFKLVLLQYWQQLFVHNNNIVLRTQAQLLLLIDFHRSLHRIMAKGFRYSTTNWNHTKCEAHRAIDRLSLNTIFGQWVEKWNFFCACRCEFASGTIINNNPCYSAV